MKLQVFDNRDHPEPGKRQVNVRIVSDEGHLLVMGIITNSDPRGAAERIAAGLRAGPIELQWTGPDDKTLAELAQQVDPVVYERAGFLVTGQTGSGKLLARHKLSTLMFQLDPVEPRWSAWNDASKDWDVWKPLEELAAFLPRSGQVKEQQTTLF